MLKHYVNTNITVIIILDRFFPPSYVFSIYPALYILCIQLKASLYEITSNLKMHGLSLRLIAWIQTSVATRALSFDIHECETRKEWGKLIKSSWRDNIRGKVKYKMRLITPPRFRVKG